MSNIKSRAMTDNVVSESEGILDVLRDVAVKVVGKVAPKKPQQFSNDPEIMSLSSERKAIAQENSQIKGPSDRTSQRKRRNYLKRSIKKRLKFLKGASADALADQINNADSCSRMFEAARTLAQGRVKKKGLTVHDADGNDIGSDSLKAEAIKEYFQKQLNDDDEPPFPAFIDPPGPLLCPITSDEVGRAVMKLKSGRACGPDGIPNELMKAAGPTLHSEYARILNQSFETNTYIPAIGEGILAPIQKSGKKRRPLESIRPITLFNGKRKVLSHVALNRIKYQQACWYLH